MKKTIPFNFFEEGQTIYFNSIRFEELESLTNKSIGDILNSTMSIGLLVSALSIGLKHHYAKKPKSFYYEKIDEFIDNGGNVMDLWQAFTKSILASGLFGKELADAILSNTAVEESPNA